MLWYISTGSNKEQWINLIIMIIFMNCMKLTKGMGVFKIKKNS